MDSLIPVFGNLAFTLVAFVVALSVIIAIHEYGHYIVGRWSGIKAEVFSLGFGPVLASRVDKHGTRWQIAALPFGGYVKFLGDKSAASDKADPEVLAELTPEERRHTMHGAPLWARAATVFAGPAFNFILSFLIFTAFVLYFGIQKEPLVISEVKPHPAAVEGLAPGDALVAIEGVPAATAEQMNAAADEIEPSPSLDYTVLRDGQEIVVEGPWLTPPIASDFSPDSAAAAAGMEPGDVVVSVNGTTIADFQELNDATRNSEGRPLNLGIWRDGETLTLSVTPQRRDTPAPDGGFETRYLIGMHGGAVIDFETETPGVIEAMGYGAERLWFVVDMSVQGIWSVINQDISTCAVSGPITIAKTSGEVAAKGVSDFIFFIAVISAAVGFMNLIPVPVLDGGHLVFHAWEALTGHPPPDRAMNVMMGIGLFLVLSLMVFAFGNDIWCRFIL
jgi:regulator of sigma E protease